MVLIFGGFASNSRNSFLRSANGAEYDSQGQALSRAKRVAPGEKGIMKRALKVRNIDVNLFRSFRARSLDFLSQGRCASLCSALAPGYHIPRRWRFALLAGGTDFLARSGHVYPPVTAVVMTSLARN